MRCGFKRDLSNYYNFGFLCPNLSIKLKGWDPGLEMSLSRLQYQVTRQLPGTILIHASLPRYCWYPTWCYELYGIIQCFGIFQHSAPRIALDIFAFVIPRCFAVLD
jgi:hypothetical protein